MNKIASFSEYNISSNISNGAIRQTPPLPEQEKAALTIQSAWRQFLALSELQNLKEKTVQSLPSLNKVSEISKNQKKVIEINNPKPLISHVIEEFVNEIEVHEIEGKLAVVKKTYDDEDREVYTLTKMSVTDFLLKISNRKNGNGRSIKNILSHEKLQQFRTEFIEYVVSTDNSGSLRLFGLSNYAIIDVLDTISNMKGYEATNSLPKNNLILQAARWGNSQLLDKVIELYPEEFLTIGQEVITELLQQGSLLRLVENVAKKFENLGGNYDTYHTLLLQTARSAKPSEQFQKDLLSLSDAELKNLYHVAFVYNNPHVYEPLDSPIPPDQYSINLMWINKNKIPSDQEFLFGNGTTFKERELDFHKRFVKPISKWAQANPGSTINIWIDSKMAHSEAIERSRQALKAALDGTSHGSIQFRDVRSIDLVTENPQVFDEDTSVYFRVDLLRAIAADYALRNKETKYFVYGDIDMKALSGKKIFDKKTVDFLNDTGFVMAKGGHLDFENGFQILNGDNSQLMDSHRKVVIDLNIEMALKKPKLIREQQIYDVYPAMITHFFDADGRYGKLNSEKNSLRQFRYDKFGCSAHRILPLGDKPVFLKEVMPRKPVPLPPTHF